MPPSPRDRVSPRERIGWRRRLLFHNFYVVYRADRLFKERFTALGKVAIGAFVLAAVFGVNTRATMSYQLAVLSLALVVVALAASLGFRVRVEAKRSLPRYATVGEPVAYRVTFSHDSSRAQRGLSAAERLGTRRPDPAELLDTFDPQDARRNWFDRHVGYPRWASMMRWRRGGVCSETALPDLPAREPVAVEMSLLPERRGYLRLDRIDVLRPDPLGLFKARVATGERESLLVLPRRYPVQWADLTTGIRDRPGGVTQAVSTDGIDEFAALREYRPGDPLRHIHWRGWARLGIPIVKEYHEEFFARQALILDVHLPEAGTRRRFEAAVSAAASFAGRGPAGSATLDLVFVGGDVHRVSCGPGLGSSARLLEALACVDMRPDQPFDLLREAVRACAQELSGCVCVLLDWNAPRREFVTELRALGLAVLVVVVVDDREQVPSHAGLAADSTTAVHVLTPDRLEEGLAGVTARSSSRWQDSSGSAPPVTAAVGGG